MLHVLNDKSRRLNNVPYNYVTFRNDCCATFTYRKPCFGVHSLRLKAVKAV